MADVVKIYKPAKNAMQSGRANVRRWVLEYPPSDPQRNDGLMGWSGSHDTNRQLKLRFDTQEEAVAFAQRKGLDYKVIEPHDRSFKPKSYADNFAYKQIS